MISIRALNTIALRGDIVGRAERQRKKAQEEANPILSIRRTGRRNNHVRASHWHFVVDIAFWSKWTPPSNDCDEDNAFRSAA